MSAIGSVSSGQGLFQFLKGLSSGSQSQSTSASTATSGTSQADATDSTSTDSISASGTSSATPSVSSHHHHRHGGKSGGFSKIESAVTSALQSAQQGGSTSDPNKVIEDAIAKIFKSGTGSSSTTGTPSATNGTSQTTTSGGTATNGSSGAAAASHQAFIQTLQSLGVSPQQFRQDFLAAVKDAQGGTSDPSTAFQSFPPGSGIDVTA